VYDSSVRLISGSIFNGHKAEGDMAYLGYYHTQVVAIPDDKKRRLMGWALPGFNLYSITGAFISKLFFWKKFNVSTSSLGDKRSFVPIGSYDKVSPYKIPITFLLRTLAAQDSDQASALGALELSEDDMGIFTYVCPSKIDYSELLRNILNTIEKEEL
jgi:Na+-transporting NADH:ubiquinone oxidoreductase subunit A